MSLVMFIYLNPMERMNTIGIRPRIITNHQVFDNDLRAGHYLPRS